MCAPPGRLLRGSEDLAGGSAAGDLRKGSSLPGKWGAKSEKKNRRGSSDREKAQPFRKSEGQSRQGFTRTAGGGTGRLLDIN